MAEVCARLDRVNCDRLTALSKFKTAESTLKNAFSSPENEPTFAEVEGFLEHVHVAFENLVFSSLALSKSCNVETRMWDVHGKVNNRYRKQFARFRDEGGKKRPVEKRKLEARYIKFIKSSMIFYRGYIQRLASHYEGIPALPHVATKLKLQGRHLRRQDCAT